ncbi:MAG: NAD(P)H-hydrate dehydratase [Candidatus Peregrinibacteria bacterium]
MQRDPKSHKGENGKVAVIGGSKTMHGAPILSALAAEASGADLIFLCLPACHCEAAKNASLNFQVYPFFGDDLAPKDTEAILELLATMDAAVIGPGVSHAHAESVKAILNVIAEAPCSLVLDASALQPQTLSLVRQKNAVLTPHLAEMERMGIVAKDLERMAEEYGATIVLKGAEDRIAFPDGSITTVSGGNVGLTAGGTGDALAGLIAGLIAQHMSVPEACVTAATIMKRAATDLFSEYGYAFGAKRVIEHIPHLLHAMSAE